VIAGGGEGMTCRTESSKRPASPGLSSDHLPSFYDISSMFYDDIMIFLSIDDAAIMQLCIRRESERFEIARVWGEDPPRKKAHEGNTGSLVKRICIGHKFSCSYVILYMDSLHSDLRLTVSSTPKFYGFSIKFVP
jgi:hypothetical protein